MDSGGPKTPSRQGLHAPWQTPENGQNAMVRKGSRVRLSEEALYLHRSAGCVGVSKFDDIAFGPRVVRGRIAPDAIEGISGAGLSVVVSVRCQGYCGARPGPPHPEKSK